MSDISSIGVDISSPKWDQSTFFGRLRHFAAITDMRKSIVSATELEKAKAIVTGYSSGNCPPRITEDKLWQAKHLYDSAFHPDTGERMNLFGRMSFQVPSGMTIISLLLQFYKTPGQVALMQWLNQSFNALVNFTNRNAASETTTRQMMFAYVTATSTALGVALGLNAYSKQAPTIVARCVPFAAVAAANVVNIPLSRQSELLHGVTITTEDGKVLGKSKKCAQKGISQVVISRVTMAAPGMVFLPMVMEHLNKKAWFRRMTWTHLPIQTIGVGVFLTFMVPTACSIFPQKASMDVSKLEHDLQKTIGEHNGNSVQKVYFNKGL
uniref:Sidoreflexin n=1 Tax=Phallusia mammillata TaxID=59560 RepID=A0A6F9DRF4_9ASCI|nr:sideroflexin-2-like [Phallusia mammillata]